MHWKSSCDPKQFIRYLETERRTLTQRIHPKRHLNNSSLKPCSTHAGLYVVVTVRYLDPWFQSLSPTRRSFGDEVVACVCYIADMPSSDSLGTATETSTPQGTADKQHPDPVGATKRRGRRATGEADERCCG